MKYVVSILILSLIASGSIAQTQFLQNPDLEDWGQQEVIGIFGPEFIYAPDAWYPFGDLFIYLLGQDADYNLFESFDAHSGLRSAELRPDSVHDYADIVSFIPAGDRPAALHGYYKMDSNPGDTLRIFFSLVDSVTNPPQIPHALSEVFITQPAANWTEFTAALDYFDQVNVPDSAIVLIGYTANSYTLGNHVLVDDLWLEYPAGLQNMIELNMNLHPNPTSDALHIDALSEPGVLHIYNGLGKKMMQVQIAAKEDLTLDVSNWAVGQYTAVFSGRKIGRATFLKIE